MSPKDFMSPPPGNPEDLKAERIQDRLLPVTPERLQKENDGLGNWQVDPTPNAISRHFPQPSFAASAAFLMKAAAHAEKHGRVPYVFVDATGVTVQLGNAPMSGVTEADLDLAAALTGIS